MYSDGRTVSGAGCPEALGLTMYAFTRDNPRICHAAPGPMLVFLITAWIKVANSAAREVVHAVPTRLNLVEMPFVRRRIHQCYAWSCSGKNGSRRDK
jgi:hypothetical protein